MPGEGCWRATLQEGGQVTPAVVKFTPVENKFKKDMALMRKTKSRGIPNAMIGGEVKLPKGSGLHFLLVMPAARAWRDCFLKCPQRIRMSS